MRIVNLPTELLRTFVAIIDLGGFTRAGDLVGRTQPAVSAQMRRLEELVGHRLLNPDSRRIELTEAGELLAAYARQILALNDEVARRLSRRDRRNALRVGLPTDYAVAFLQEALTEFAAIHPEVQLEIRCELSNRILAQLQEDELDIAIAMTAERAAPYLARAWVERPIWVAAADLEVHRQDPVPLVCHPEGCEYRGRMIQALSLAGRKWRIAFCSPGITGLQNAVRAGLGVSALTQRTLLPGMRVLGPEDGFPPLEDIRVGLYYKHPRLGDAGLQLADHLRIRLDSAPGGEFRRPERY